MQAFLRGKAEKCIDDYVEETLDHADISTVDNEAF